VRFADFEALVRRIEAEVPAEFLVGIQGVEVSRQTVPHPTRPEVYTLGECIPLPSEGEGSETGLQSRVVLYHGSFVALAHQADDFDWRNEAWETLTHELRHHLEWRARAPDLEAFDWAAEQNFARADGEPFDPDFHLAAELVTDGVFRIDDDYFLDREVPRLPEETLVNWHGRAYLITLPAGATLPGFFKVTGISDPPPGDLFLVLRERSRLRDLFHPAPEPFQATVEARPVPG
jgi:hypothetical protein